MSTKQQIEIKDKYYREALRYMSNARDTLKKAGRAGNYYPDDKYVKTACGTAYSGVLKALDGYLLSKEIPHDRRRKSIEYYQSNIGTKDKKLNTELSNAYKILHLAGYYDGVTSVKVITAGFDLANSIIKRIEP